ncbi:transcriptional regulatory protein MalR [Thalassobacillus devorans]|uniref:Transcriptional regulatory protein MalR n=1 Tax=Thalassobacillus devorans TaxID=279813 RepID=A0ABQ1PF39_9BACI|nr:response regulator [Thalassobacillus devorans]NIK29337.1 response regulator of citrate/malate metabolism [Thalassobacillus devorans]GGC95887.1 transcriptional regulatory protein MalR [Thalassobacillus devorans]
MIKVLIVEDDPMVAALNRQYVEQVEGFTLSGTAANTNEAVGHMAQIKIDLILLDVYMPGLNGIDFLRQIREQNEDVDVILITAASEMEQIQQSLRLGAIDYLIKPFEFDRFQEALTRYKNNYYKLHHKSSVSQQELDRLFRKKSQPASNQPKPQELPKGLTKNTLQTINEVILSYVGQAFSTEDIAEAANISRVSIRKYLKFLTDIGYLEEDLIYGVGRPIYQYQLHEDRQHIIACYL